MRSKIIVSLFALFGFFAVGTFIAVTYMSSSTEQLKRIIELHEVEQLRRSLIIKIQNVQTDLYAVNTALAPELDFIVSEAAALDEASNRCSSCHHEPKLLNRIHTVQTLVHDYEKALSYYITASANAGRIDRLKKDAVDIGDRLLRLAGEMSHSASRNLHEMTNESMKRLDRVGSIMFVTIAITLLLGIIVAIHLTRSVTRPVSALVHATRLISSGKFGSTTSYRDRTEFGELAEHFNTMSTAIKQGYDKIQKEVAERILAEEALRESEARFRTFFEVSPIGILIYPMHAHPLLSSLKQTTFNAAFHNFFGYTREELEDMKIADISHPDDMQKNVDLVNALLSGRQMSYRMEKRYIKKNGDIFWGYLNATALPKLHGKPPQIMATLVDITERKKMEEEQLKIQKLESVGILAGGIAHDFNNVLTSIVVNISRARMASNADKIPDILSDVEKACRHARDLTSKLITFSKGGSPIRKIISIREQLKESTLFALKGSQMQCEFSIPDDLWNVEADAGQINQVILNLVINAIQASDNSGIIRVRAENITAESGDSSSVPTRDSIRITIQDEGSGIAAEHMPKIFDPYFTTKKRGSGLGLSSAYSIIKNHEGYIDVQSAEGKGAIFSIYLPAIKEKPLPEPAEGDGALRGEGRVLLMDDDASLRTTLKKTLVHLGYTVSVAREGSEALALYKKAMDSGKPYDAIIIDLTIAGGMGGEETIRHLRALDPHVKAIVSSGYSADSVMANFRDHGFSGIITKPYEIEELNEVLHSVIQGNV